MVELLTEVAAVAMLLHVGMMAVVVWRIWRGETVADRLVGVDLVTTLLISILIILSISQRDSIYIDLALALAALGFISTIALAKYLADEQMF
jgi:multisubunit Na+/H+ antiporter MnhF subunit